MGYLDKEKAIELLTGSEGTEFVVRTKKDEETFVAGVLENGVNEKIGDRISEIHKQYDEDIFKLTGKRKEATQKTYDFNKQIITGLTQDAERYVELKPKYDALEKSKGGEDLTKELDQVRADALTAKGDHENAIKELTQKYGGQQKSLHLDAAIAGLKFNDAIPESVRKSHIEKVRAGLINTSEIKEGVLVFLKEDGNPALNDKFEVKSVNEMVVEQLVDILTKGQNGLNLKKDYKPGTVLVLPDHITTKDGVTEFMKTIPGLEMHSDEWTKKYKELTKNLK